MSADRLRGVGLAMVGVALLALAAPAAARADAVIDWNQHAIDALVAPPPGAAQAPPVSALHMAMVHGAVYDAVNAIDRGHQPYLGAPHARWWHSKDAAAATAPIISRRQAAWHRQPRGCSVEQLAPMAKVAGG